MYFDYDCKKWIRVSVFRCQLILATFAKIDLQIFLRLPFPIVSPRFLEFRFQTEKKCPEFMFRFQTLSEIQTVWKRDATELEMKTRQPWLFIAPMHSHQKVDYLEKFFISCLSRGLNPGPFSPVLTFLPSDPSQLYLTQE